MKRLFLGLLSIFLFTNLSCFNPTNLLEISVDAQTFPATVHTEVDPPLASDNVVAMNVTIDSGTPVSTLVTVTTCPVLGTANTVPCVKSSPIVIADGNAHVATVSFTNAFGTGPVLSINFKVALASKPNNGNVRGGS